MASFLSQTWQRLNDKLGFEREWYLMIIAAAIGVVMGAVAYAFIMPLRKLEELAAHLGGQRGALHLAIVGGMPVVGALLAGLVIHFMRDESRSLGVSRVIYAIHRDRSRLPLRAGLRMWIASTLTIGSGGSAGPEGPIVTIGASIGSAVGRLIKANPQSAATLVGCAAAAGIASVFNAPIAGIFFVLEVLLRDFSLRTFTPIVIASVISAAWTQTMIGSNEPLFGVSPDFFLGTAGFDITEIPNFIVLGVACGLFAPAFVRSLYWTDQQFSRLKLHPALRPALGAVVLGLAGVAYVSLAAPSFTQHGTPPFYGDGYPVIVDLLSPSYYFADAEHTLLNPVVQLLVALVLITILKAVATCLTIGSGGAGGLFAPSLFMGAGLGGLVGTIVKASGILPAVSPAHYALVGMAAMIAATTHAPLTGMLLAYEITRRYEIVLPLMLAAVISAVAARLSLRDSVYTWRLSRMGVRLGAMSDWTILRRLSARDVPLTEAVLVHPDDSVRRLLDLSEENHVTDFVVVDANRHYLGMVTGADLRSAMLYQEVVPLLQVSELQRSDLPTISPDETLDVVLEKFSRHDLQSLAVLGPAGDGAVLGVITRSRLMRLYQSELHKD